MSAKIIPIRAFKDNYIWLFFDETSHETWAVDPGDAQPVIDYIQRYHLTLKGIIVTHHHHDHSGGVIALQKSFKNLLIYSSHQSPLKFITHRIKDGDTIHCCGIDFKVFEIPGHTLDHIAVLGNHWLFCGDTLFSMGCGKIFEGTPPQMYQSLNKLKELPDITEIYCGHEYTLANLAFAQSIEPSNFKISDKINEIKKIRMQSKPTLPSTMLDEKKLNPFLRCEQEEIHQAVEDYVGRKLSSPIEVFSHLRDWKNKQ